MRPEATVQRRGNRSAPDFSWLFASSAMYVASLTGMTREKRNHIRHHQPQKPTVRESGVAPKGAMREWYIARAKDRILPRVVKQARELGVSFGQARIVDSRYRWGSCTVRDNINLNWRLIKAPIFVIDYVIVHELAHLLEPNHTPRFWNIVKTQVPTMDRARGWLKEHGEILEEEV